MRIILYTGKGGVGKTSMAAATGAAAAAAGKKTLVVSTDAAHSLGDSLDRTLGPSPVPVGENLWAQEISAQAGTEKGWHVIRGYLTRLFASQKVETIQAEELLVFPGLEELLSLFAVLEHYREGQYDVMVVDCASTGETLRLLSLPEVMGWWLEKIFPIQRMVLQVARPLAMSWKGVPLPDNSVLDSIGLFFAQLKEMQEILTDKDRTTVRIVVNPEKMVVKEAERSLMYLNLYGFHTDAVIVNRLLPPEKLGEYFSRWEEVHRNHLAYIREQFQPVPIFPVPLFRDEVVGLESLRRMSRECFCERDPAEIFYTGRLMEVKEEKDAYVLEVAASFVSREEVDVSRQGDELTVRLGEYKRNIPLPAKLRGLEVTGARLDGGQLRLVFGKTPQGEAGKSAIRPDS